MLFGIKITDGVVSASADTSAAQDTFFFLDIRKYGISANMNGFDGTCPDTGITCFAFAFI
jgi:hypothetical protein